MLQRGRIVRGGGEAAVAPLQAYPLQAREGSGANRVITGVRTGVAIRVGRTPKSRLDSLV